MFTGRLICIALVLNVAFFTCNAQEPPASGGLDEIQSFALQIVNAPSQQRPELLAAHPKLITTGLRKELVRRGNILLIDGKYAPAFDVYELAHKVAEQIGDKEGLAATALNIGSVYYFQGNYEPAAAHYRKAQQLFASLENRLEAAKSLYGLALTYQAQRKLADSLKTFEQALREFETLDDRNEIVNTLAEIGSLQYDQGNYDAATKTFLRISSLRESGENLVRIADAFYRQHDYSQALVYYQRSLDHFGRYNAAGMIAALNGAAHCYYYQGEYDQALALYNRSLTIAENLRDQSGVATQLQNIGNIYRVRGDYGAALQSYFKSLSVATTAPTQASVATTLGSIGLVRALQADNAQAIEYFDKSLKAFETNGDQVGMARMLSHIGNVRFTQGLYDLALEAYEKSLSLHRARTDHLNQAHLLSAIGTVYLSQQNYPAALAKYHESLTIYESLGRTPDIAEALTKLAAAHRQQDHHEKGLEFAQRAVNLARGKDLPSLLWVALTESGRLQQGLNRPAEALSAFTEAIRIHQATRTQFGADSETGTSGVLPYFGAIEVLIDQNKPLAALEHSENAKSEVLREIIHRGNFRITKGMTPAEQKEESRLLGDVSSLKLRLTGIQERDGSDSAAIAALRTRLSTARAAGESFRKRLYRKHPQLAVYRGELAPVKIEQVRSMLRTDMAILEYAVTTDRVFLFVVTTDESTISSPGSQKRISRRSSPTLLVKAYALAIKPAEIAQRTARELYDLLLKPAESEIATKSRLMIIPDGVVWDVPFAALQPAESKYLLDQKMLSYAISISALKEMRKPRSGRVPARGVLAFGNPTFADELADRMKTTYRDLELPQVPPQSEEIDLKTIYGKISSQFYTGAGATKEQAKAQANNYNVIHFATPTILDQSVPLYSFIMLPADPKVPDDGLLRLWEVINLNSKAKLVVFPSAAFAQIEARSGNALIAMSWAWYVAGTPTVKLRLRRSPRYQNPRDWDGFMVLGVP